jgi:hypothetical protein
VNSSLHIRSCNTLVRSKSAQVTLPFLPYVARFQAKRRNYCRRRNVSGTLRQPTQNVCTTPPILRHIHNTNDPLLHLCTTRTPGSDTFLSVQQSTEVQSAKQPKLSKEIEEQSHVRTLSRSPASSASSQPPPAAVAGERP